MKGLLYKDWALIAGGYKSNFLFLLLFYTLFTVLCRISFLAYAMVFVLGMYASSTITMDESSHWDAYAHTLPVTPGQLVGAKYLLTLILTAVSVPLGFVMTLLIPDSRPALAENLVGLFSSLGVTLLYLSLVIPLSYRFGAAKARSWVSVSILVLAFGPAALFMLLPENLPNPLKEGLRALTLSVDASGMSELQFSVLFLAALLLISLTALLISWVASVHLYRKKQF